MTKLCVAVLGLCFASACGSSTTSDPDASLPGSPDGDLPGDPDGDLPGAPDAAVTPDAAAPDATPPDASPPDATPLPSCGDGEVNVPGEVCDLGDANSVYGRCGPSCRWGAGLDGTIGTMWEDLADGTNAYGLQSFHYSGAPLLHDFSSFQAYDVAANSWAPIAGGPFGGIWSNAAVASDALYVARDTNMYRYDLALGAWTTVAMGIPNGAVQLSAHTFDGDGFIWYHGPGNDLVRFDPTDNTFTTFTHDPAGEMFETRVVYDPVTNSILFAGFINTALVKFDLATSTFTTLPPSPGGVFRDHTCGDRSGHVYTGADDANVIWQLDVAAGTWTSFATPEPHDNNSTCVVSEDGYYYFSTSGNLWRISLGTYP